MNPIRNPSVLRKFSNEVFRGVANTATKAEGMEKFSKFGASIINAFQFGLGDAMPECWINLRSQLSGVGDSLGATQFFIRVKELFCDQDRIFKSKTSTAKWSFLIVGNFFETLKYAHKVGLVELGEFAKFTWKCPFFRHIPLPGVELIKDFFISISAIFAIKENVGVYHKAAWKKNEFVNCADVYRNKWNAKLNLLNSTDQTPEAQLDQWRNEYVKSRKVIEAQHKTFDNNYKPITEGKIEIKWDDFKNKIENPQKRVQVDLVKGRTICQWKLDKVDLESANQSYIKRKSVLGIINDLAKITIMLVGNTIKIVAAALTGGLSVALTWWTSLGMTALGVGVGFSGYVKFWNEWDSGIKKRPHNMHVFA